LKKRIFLSPPHLSDEKFELNYTQAILTNQQKKPRFQNLNKALEEDLESYLGTNRKIVALNSATSALHLALIMSGIVSDDDVIVQTATYAASVFPVKYVNANPVFIDSEEDTWNMCPQILETAIKDRISKGKKPKAIIVVHLYGMPAKIDEIQKIALKYNIVLIEDAAEALGSKYKSQYCGTFGDYGLISFNTNKIVTTFGGGALICKTIDQKEKIIFLATQAKDSAPHYQHSAIGYNYRMNNMIAGVGRGQMKVLQSRIEQRRSNNEMYKQIFTSIKGVKVFGEKSDNFYSNHWLSVIYVDKEEARFSREDLRLALENDNIESRPFWKPMHLQPVFELYPYYGKKIAEDLFMNGLCLPSGSNLTSNDFERIAQVVSKLKHSNR